MPSPVPVPTKIRFDTFELDVTAGEVRKGGITLKLQPQPFRVLLLLIERAGQVVTREEIQRALWTDSTFVDFDHGINFSINQIRRALADNAEKPRYIETLPKRGYRFIGVVQKSPMAKQSPTPEDVPEARHQSTKEVLVYPLRPGAENVEFPSRPASQEKSLGWKVAMLTGAAVILLSSVGLGMRLWKSHKASLNLGKMRIVRLTESGNAEDVAISPNGEYVAYVLREGEKLSLNVRQVSTGSEVQILSPEVVELRSLTFSPGGDYIFFLRTAKENFSVDYLYQIPILGGTPRKLIRDVDTPVSFSPDGKEFAFVRIGSSPSAGTHLMIANADGSGERVLASHPGHSQAAPAWSPDGKTIAFPRPSLPGEGEDHLWTVSPVDGTMRSIYKTRSSIGSVRWLPDGSGLLAVISDGAQGQGQIWDISYPSGEAKRVTNDLSNYEPGALDLARDGKSLVAVENTISSDLWVASGDHFGQAKQITSGRTAVLGVSAGPKRTILFNNQKGDLYSIQEDGSALVLLSPDIHNIRNPSLCGVTPYLVFQSNHDIWRMDIDGSHLTQLTKSGDSYWPTCSLSGQSVQYYSDGKNWRIPIGGGTPTQVNINNLAAFPGGYSPDGKLLAYNDFGPGGDTPNRVAVVPEAGGEPVYSFSLRGDAIWQPVRWAANGISLDYFLTNNGVGNIWRQPIPKGPPWQVTNFTSGRIFSFDWSSDRKELYVARGSILSDIVLITNFR
ncbi:MAG TPA: winged helix-turn-helix domain-containing protein [Candidatus Acidoferrum sp.]|nr:winged helix-turn-helix domain-containing protein [Candidatus Acidoferrum sp.]